ncbi:uncharacterized protein LOC112600287 [Melanaphis sacchari]|uniref:uncharacterized protein LOC112600287 n=1 Tax=Melanaphis sacchari TaxID=742174 RepID=UPI000DC154BA|nr:uncharacterized protein LOC112600287 [Melanaphis sacchari]
MEKIHVQSISMAVIMLIMMNIITQSFAEPPKRPPKIDIGNFEYVLSSVNDITRDVIVYWQNIHEDEKHTIDNSFEYRAYYTSLSNNNTILHHPCNKTFANHAMFIGLELNIGYNIRVYSANKDGLSTDYASIYIPSSPERNDTVTLSLTKVKMYNDQGIYELSWKIYDSEKLFATNQLNYYTLYWCENDMIHPNQCNGYMDWIIIPRTETSYIISVPEHWKNYQFAISANSRSLKKSDVNINEVYKFKSISSGLVWESCTTLHITKTSKLKSVWISEVGDTYMALRWKFDCLEKSNLYYDFHVSYCSIHSLDNLSCLDSSTFMVVNEFMKQDQTPFVFLKQLEPSTTYKILVSIYFINDSIIESDPIVMATLPITE